MSSIFLENFSEGTKDILKRSLLECSLLFHYNNDTLGEIRGNLFLRAILSIFVQAKLELTYNDVRELYKKNHNVEIDKSTIEDAIKQLVKSEWVVPCKDGFKAHKRTFEIYEAESNDFESDIKCFINTIIDKTEQQFGNKLDNNTKESIRNNVKNTIILFVQLYSIDYVIGNDSNNKPENEDIILALKQGISDDIASFLIDIFANILKQPTEKERNVLLRCVRIFIGAQILKLDPLVSQIEIEKLRTKKFILDTDFVLYSITKHCKQSIQYRKLLTTLRKIGCTIIIPNEVVREVQNHAYCAENNYERFKSTLDSVDEDVIEEEAKNVFVKDYCLARLKYGYSKSLKVYMSDNYIGQEDTEDYLKQLILDEFKIKAGLNEDLQDIEDYKSVTSELIKKIIKISQFSDKDKWRDDEQTEELAKTDAKLLLNTLYLNKEIWSKSNRGIFNAETYLVTYTTKSIKSAKELNIYHDVVTRPEILINLLNDIGILDESDEDIFNLFDNPFLDHIISENWDLITALTKTGIDLRDKSITRLNKDVGDLVHLYLTNNSDNDSILINASYKFNQFSNIQQFRKFAKAIESRNYNFMPEVSEILNYYEQQEQAILEAQNKAKVAEETLNRRAQGYKHYIEQQKKNSLKKIKKKKHR